MIYVIHADALFLYTHPSDVTLMFLKHLGFLNLPITHSGSLSEPSPLQDNARVKRSLLCFLPSNYFVARELSAYNVGEDV
jgi:hypothetical protein